MMLEEETAEVRVSDWREAEVSWLAFRLWQRAASFSRPLPPKRRHGRRDVSDHAFRIYQTASCVRLAVGAGR